MSTLGLAMLFIPLVLMGAMGAYYLARNKLTRYHTEIVRVAGEWALSKELLHLFGVNCAALVVLALTAPGLPRGERIAALDGPTAFLSLGSLIAIKIVAEQFEYSLVVLTKKIAGVSMVTLAWALGARFYVFYDIIPRPAVFWIASGLEVVVCLAVTIDAALLGRRAKTKTPWKVLAFTTFIGATGLLLNIIS